MQRQLHISLRLLCRHQCRRRLYSSHSAALQQHRPLDTSYDETVASSASHLDDHTDDPTSSETSHSRPDEAGVSINKKDKKLRSGADEKDSDKRRSGPNKVDTYLASLRAGGIEPTLGDLLQLNPRKRPSSDSPRYAAAYTELLHRLCRTFSKTQLRHFVQELKLDSVWASAKQRKEDYAKFIMEKHWGWDSLKEVERRKSDKSEILIKSFHMSAKELFLLLGRDGSELLQISIDYNVHMSVSPNPLSIQIEGSKGSLRRLEALIVERKKAIIEEIVELPSKTPFTPNHLQHLSRIADAYIENVGHKGKVRIYANNQRRLDAAKRLTMRASVNINRIFHTSLFALLSTDDTSTMSETKSHAYALFPFLPQRSLPWTGVPGSTFRCRKVSEWLEDKIGSNSQPPVELADGSGKLLAENGVSSTVEDVISNVLLEPSDSRIVTASIGHVLVVAKSPNERPSILPPFAGHWKYPEFMKWMEENNADRLFVPSLPSPLHDAPPTQEKIVHQLTYRLLPNNSKLAKDVKTTGNTPTKKIIAEVVITEQRRPRPEQNVTEPETKRPLVGNDVAESVKTELDEVLIEDRPYASSSSENSQAAELAGSLNSLDSDTSALLASDISSTDPQSGDSIGDETMADAIADVERFSVEATEAVDEEQSISDAPFTTEDVPIDISTVKSFEPERDGSHINQVDVLGEPLCRRGSELELLVALPDRPMDVKLTVLDAITSFTVDELPELRKYFTTLKEYLDNPNSEKPEPPLFIEDGKETFILESSASIRRSVESLHVASYAQQDLDSNSDGESASRPISTVTESISDLETGHKMINCEISCFQPSVSEQWKKFLKDIDGLTTLGYRPVSKASPSRFSLDSSKSSSEDGFLD